MFAKLLVVATIIAFVSAEVAVPTAFTNADKLNAVDADAVRMAFDRMQADGQARRYAYSSGASGATGATSGYSSGASGATATTKSPTKAPTAAPTPTPTVAGAPAKKITQEVTMSGTVAGYTGATKLLCENSYAKEIGITTLTGGKYVLKTGCAVTSTAVAARRTSIKVTLEATVTADIADAAKAKATAMTPASLSASMAAVKASDAQYAAVTVPTVSAIKAPTMTTVVSGVERSATFGVLALVAGVMAMRQ